MKTSFKNISPIYQNKYEFVENNIKNIMKNKKVLDVGCGYGEYLQLYQKRGFKVTGIDIDKKAIKDVKNAKYGSVTNLPFKNRSFDIINCIDVLEHVYDEEKSFSEISRVIKKGGILIMTVPNASFPITYDPINKLLSIFKKHIKIGIWHWGHKKLYSKENLFQMLNKYNFKIAKYEQKSHLFTALFVNYIPYIIDKFILKGTYKEGKKSPPLFLIKKVYKVLNSIDQCFFKKFSGINHCIVAFKV